MKGSIPRSRRRFLEQRGAAVLAGIGEAIGPEARRYLVDEVLVTERVPFAPLVDLDRQIALQVMQGDVAQMRIFAHEIATHDLDGGLYRGLLGTLGRALSLKLWASLYQSYWQPGHVTATSTAHGTSIVLHEMVVPRYMCRYGFTGYVERLLEIARAPGDVMHVCAHEGASRCEWIVTPR